MNKKQRIAKLENQIAQMRTQLAVMQFNINDLKETLKDVVSEPKKVHSNNCCQLADQAPGTTTTVFSNFYYD